MALFGRLTRRAGPVGLVLTAIDLWGRLTPAQRRRVLRATRKHGPKVAKAAARHARNRRGL
jgi:hypothetical protein